MITLLLTMLLSSQPTVYSREPHAASPWVQSTRASCGRTSLVISGYGAANPLDHNPSVSLNGRPIVGRAVRQLISDLGHRRAAYRIQVLCGGSNDITVRIDEGEKQKDETVRYRSGAAFINGNRLTTYKGLAEADASAFWFR